MHPPIGLKAPNVPPLLMMIEWYMYNHHWQVTTMVILTTQSTVQCTLPSPLYIKKFWREH